MSDRTVFGMSFGVAGAALLCTVLVLFAVFAPVFATHDPVQASLSERLQPPMWVEGGSSSHYLGTDTFGRDIYSRLLYGARISLGVAALAIFIGGGVGVVLGVVAGHVGGWFDAVIMRVADILLALPIILVAIAVAVAVGPSFRNVILIISFFIWPRMARQLRGEALALKQQEFVRYAKAVGVPAWRVMVTHVLPNVLPTLIVIATLEIGHIILIEASLGFLGAGVPPPDPSWGVMVADGRALLVTGWWIALFPGLAIVATVLVFNTLGDWLRVRLDPRLKQR